MEKYLLITSGAIPIASKIWEPREVHHFATLLGYGACAINPYLAQDTIKELIESNMLDKDYYAAVDDYNNAVLHGIVKIASKMGISTIQSYQGSPDSRINATLVLFLVRTRYWFRADTASREGMGTWFSSTPLSDRIRMFTPSL